MRRWLWTAGALASTVWAFGCARTVRIDEAKLGQLPLADKQAIFTAQHNVTVAQANEAAVKRAGDQALTFRDEAKAEFSSAKDRAKAASKALELGQKTNDETLVRDSQRRADLASKELVAARSKVDYADGLVKLRAAEGVLARDHVVAAQNDLAFVQADALRRHGINPGVNTQNLVTMRDRDNATIMKDERDVASLRDQVNALHVAWDQRRQSFNVAQREIPSAPPVRAPREPHRLRPEPLPEAPPAPTPPPATPPSGGQTM